MLSLILVVPLLGFRLYRPCACAPCDERSDMAGGTGYDDGAGHQEARCQPPGGQHHSRAIRDLHSHPSNRSRKSWRDITVDPAFIHRYYTFHHMSLFLDCVDLCLLVLMHENCWSHSPWPSQQSRTTWWCTDLSSSHRLDPRVYVAPSSHTTMAMDYKTNQLLLSR